MVSADTARTVVGIAGNITAFGLYLSPVPTFCHIWKRGSVEQFAPTPYFAAILNCMLWVIYGLPMVHPHCMLIVTVNGSGLVIELAFVIMFLYFCDRNKRLRLLAVILVEIAFAGVVLAFILTVVHTHERRSLIVGSLAVFFASLMYASPLSILKMVIKTRSVEYLPFFLSFTSFANGFCWTAYALIRFDLFVLIPNGLGALFGLIQLALHAAFYKSTRRQLAESRKAEGEPGLAEIILVGEPKEVCNVPQNGQDYSQVLTQK